MPLPKGPVTEPVTFSFPDAKQLTSIIDTEIKRHSVACDLCGCILNLGIRASGHPLTQHRGKGVFTLKMLNYMFYFHFTGAVAQIVACASTATFTQPPGPFMLHVRQRPDFTKISNACPSAPTPKAKNQDKLPLMDVPKVRWLTGEREAWRAEKVVIQTKKQKKVDVGARKEQAKVDKQQ